MKDILLKTLTTGADGMVGSYIDFGIRLGRKELDVTDLKQVMRTVREHRPKAILHLAAATDLDRCEREPDWAYRVNSAGTYHLALAAQAVNAKFIYISTDSVFADWDKKPHSFSDTPNPRIIYGHSKYLGELAVRGILDNYAIIRTCWIFGGGNDKDKKLVGKIMRKISQNEPKIEAAKDHFGSPTYAKDLVGQIKKILLNDSRGVFHVTNKGLCSRYDEVREIVKIAGAQTKVVPVPASKFGFSNDRLREGLQPHPDTLRSWQGALKEYIETEW